MSETPCQDECHYLVELARRLENSVPDGKLLLNDWHNRAEKLLASKMLESLAGEQELERLSLELRTKWLRYSNRVSSHYMKSPPHFQSVRLPSGELSPFPYDRWNQPGTLEKRVAAYRASPAGWLADHILFNSGMGAINCLFQVMRKVFEPSFDSPLRLHGVGGYFEIMDLMQLNHDALFQYSIHGSQAQFQQSVAAGESQLIYIEPVYTRLGRIEVFDMEGFFRAWATRPASIPTAIVLDTTFVGNRFPVGEFLDRLAPQLPRLVIQISSTLKLDQEGLEFSNAGLMTLYSTVEPLVSGVATRLRKYRAMTGMGLTFEQTAALDYPGFLDPDVAERHSTPVFENNAVLARELDVGSNSLFTDCFHPVLDEANAAVDWAVAPFVNLQLAPDTDKVERELLKQVLFREASERGVVFKPGSSFGFRAHRVETSIQNEEGGVQVIRVAMGSRKGPALQGTIDLLNDLARLGNYEKLKSSYPELLEKVRRYQPTQTTVE